MRCALAFFYLKQSLKELQLTDIWREGQWKCSLLQLMVSVQQAKADERLIDVINRSGSKVPQVCYHPQLGPVQTCDTCMVES